MVGLGIISCVIFAAIYTFVRLKEEYGIWFPIIYFGILLLLCLL